jgi:hypothetical protein
MEQGTEKLQMAPKFQVAIACFTCSHPELNPSKLNYIEGCDWPQIVFPNSPLIQKILN